MRQLPLAPPVTPATIARTAAQMSQPAVQRYIAEANAQYYHWEKLRHLPAPEGLKPEDSWWLVKLSRGGQGRPLPLQDKKGEPFTYWLPLPSLEILHQVDRWSGTTLLPEGGAPLLNAMRDQVVISSLMEEAIATSQIEGAVTTRKVAKEMLRTNRKPRDRSEQMIVNSYRTIQLLKERLDRPLSLDLLLKRA